MDARINLLDNPLGAKFLKHLVAANAVIDGSSLPAATRELVKIRARQINGCAFCLDMHTKDAAHAGETATRLHRVAAWQEATAPPEAGPPALELPEQATRPPGGAGGYAKAWARAAKHHDEERLAAVVGLTVLFNAFNRGNLIVGQPAGDYQPGQFG